METAHQYSDAEAALSKSGLTDPGEDMKTVIFEFSTFILPADLVALK